MKDKLEVGGLVKEKKAWRLPALHPRTIMAFKNPKHVVALFVANEDPGGYWEDKGYNRFSGS